MLDLSTLTGIGGFALTGGLGLMFGIRSAFTIARTNQSNGELIEIYDCSADLNDETAYKDWIESRFSIENQKIIEQVSCDEIDKIYIVEVVHGAEVIRVPVIEGPFSGIRKVGNHLPVLIDRRDPRRAQFGTLLSHWLTAFIGIPLGVFCSAGAIVWAIQLITAI